MRGVVESEIREALTNLIFNAVDAMPDGGALTLRTRVISAPGNAGQPPLPTFAQIEVVDTGVGMKRGDAPRCMELFFTTKGERGTGLGLAMVYGMTQRHSAELEIQSEVGRGTTMRLSFGVPAAGTVTPEAPAPLPAVSRPLHILVVDDDPVLLKSLRDTLQQVGHRVVTAGGGKEGIDAFQVAAKKADKFDAVITDLGMPHVDGRQVASAIKTASPSTPVILLTGWGQRLAAESDLPPHVDRLLAKPPKLRELREALGRLCPS